MFHLIRALVLAGAVVLACTSPTVADEPGTSGASSAPPTGVAQAPSPQSNAATAPSIASPADADFAKGLATYNKQDYAAAISSFEAAIRSNPESADAYFYLGYSLYKLKKFDESRVAFTQLYKLQPTYRPPLTIPR